MIDGLSARNNQTSLPFMGASPMRLRHASQFGPEPTLGKLMCEPLITLTGPSATGPPRRPLRRHAASSRWALARYPTETASAKSTAISLRKLANLLG